TWHDWLNLRSLTEVSRVIALAARKRENSRGAHFRSDFPEPGDLASSRFTVARQTAAGLDITDRPVALTHVRPGEPRLDKRAASRATAGVPLRPNRVHPLWRTDHNNNVGIGAPEIEYAFHPDADWIDLITVHKGGLFGSDYRMLFPGDGIDGIRRFYLDTLI